MSASLVVRTATDSAGPGLWAAVRRSAGAKLVVLPVSALLGVVLTRLVIDAFGVAAFAQYGLLVALGALLPFADLGMAAAVMNAVAASPDPGSDPHVRRVLVTATRALLGSAAVLIAAALGLWVLDLWPILLGEGLLPGQGPAVATLCLLLIAAALPVGLGQRILAGLGSNHLSVVVLGAQTPLVLAAVALLVWWEVPAGAGLAVVAYAVTLILSAVLTVIAARRLHPVVGLALRDAMRLRTVRGARVLDVAWPMLVQMLALPLAMQSDRIVLSHRTGSTVLAEYNLAAQMFTPVWAVVSAGGITLWSTFARARARGESVSPSSTALAFGAAAAVMAGAVALLSPVLAGFASGGRITLGVPLVLAFVVLMTLQGLKYPLGMAMTDAAGLRYQAVMIVLMLPVNVGLSWWLAGHLGAVGPVVGSIVGVAAFQCLANAWYVRRHGPGRVAA
ncbi:Membrane protein involved in the export of O-antigen and teichoic acid [Blastococcus sp. DSM 46786]|uniref:lipopolysaccharide biosynthesis protein n=1 Tax=Blastococcus sp. DSM 46786 TaxID=1798227 RepID=UPI0008C6642B|nr:oligosaccharide flippase family protein [Blastococcus sp. DSM 46786]SEL20561.1 Membrane protein involved in the export of O-antigen and teichoic acid [Blastococcus sp. DSM 46786]